MAYRENEQINEPNKVDRAGDGHIKRSCIDHRVRDGLGDEPRCVEEKGG